MLKVKYKIFAGMLFLLLCFCRTIWVNTSIDNDSSGATSVAQLKISSTDVNGWQPVTSSDSFSAFSASSLHNLIDGGDKEYVQKGLIEGSIQNLTGASQKRLEIYCMDFGSETKARDMLNFEKDKISTRLAIPYYNDSLATAFSVLTGITAYSYFNKFYIELHLTGFQDQTEALQAASLFLDLYSSKIE